MSCGAIVNGQAPCSKNKSQKVERKRKEKAHLQDPVPPRPLGLALLQYVLSFTRRRDLDLVAVEGERDECDHLSCVKKRRNGSAWNWDAGKAGPTESELFAHTAPQSAAECSEAFAVEVLLEETGGTEVERVGEGFGCDENSVSTSLVRREGEGRTVVVRSADVLPHPSPPRYENRLHLPFFSLLRRNGPRVHHRIPRRELDRPSHRSRDPQAFLNRRHRHFEGVEGFGVGEGAGGGEVGRDFAVDGLLVGRVEGEEEEEGGESVGRSVCEEKEKVRRGRMGRRW
jgi:hypothetical protein